MPGAQRSLPGTRTSSPLQPSETPDGADLAPGRLPLRPLLQQVGLGTVSRKAGCKDPSGSEACEGRSTRLHAPGVGQSEGTSPHRSEGPPPSLMEADRRRHRAHRSGSCRPTRCDCAIDAPNMGGSSPEDGPALLLTAAMPPGSPAEPCPASRRPALGTRSPLRARHRRGCPSPQRSRSDRTRCNPPRACSESPRGLRGGPRPRR